VNSPAEKVPSPCNNVCQLDPDTGYCRGCLRTIEEIAGWVDYSNEEKLAVLERLEERKQFSR
jgi:predicted Fe-S protein YdhL (DUF1289 family)